MEGTGKGNAALACALICRSRWQAAVQKPFEARRPEGRERLVALLRQVMIRAAKADLLTLPRLEYKVVGQRVCSQVSGLRLLRVHDAVERSSIGSNAMSFGADLAFRLTNCQGRCGLLHLLNLRSRGLGSVGRAQSVLARNLSNLHIHAWFKAQASRYECRKLCKPGALWA